MFGNVFAAVLNMSIIALVAAVLIILFRWIFNKKLPRIFFYALWAIVLFRLLIPFSFPSTVSLFNAIPAPGTIINQSLQNGASNNTGNTVNVADKTNSGDLKSSINNALPSASPETQADQSKLYIFIFSSIWAFGAIGLFSVIIYAYFRTYRRLREAVLYKQNHLISDCSQKLKLNMKIQIYTSDQIHTPVLCGLIKPRIILPSDIIQDCSISELKHIITHELVHIKRFDYIIKPLSVLALCVHWFNPLMWVGFILAQKDMEMACDEKVISVYDNDIRSDYASSLIKVAIKQNSLLNGGLLAFGESNIKSRIKGIMNYKKSRFWIAGTAIVVLLAIGLVFLTNGQSKTITINSSDIRSQVTGMAWGFIKENISNYESVPEVKIIESKITRLEVTKSFDNLANAPIDVYALEYRLLPKDLKKVVLAGGMQVDEAGWLKETSSMGSPMLVILRKPDQVKLLGILWSGGLSEDGGLEASINVLLKRYNDKENKIADINKLLSTIMSSPLSSSNTGDYIKAHQKEYDEIVLMGEEALPHLNEILNGGDKGLRGNIVWLLCDRIVKNLSQSKDISPNTEKLVKETNASISKWKVMMGY